MFRAFYYFIFFLKKQYRDKRENLFLFHKIFSVFVFSVYRDYRIFGKTTQHAHVQVSNRRYHILSATGCSHLCNALLLMGGICRLVDIVDAVGCIPHCQNHRHGICDPRRWYALSSVGLPLFPSYRGNRNQKHLHETE